MLGNLFISVFIISIILNLICLTITILGCRKNKQDKMTTNKTTPDESPEKTSIVEEIPKEIYEEIKLIDENEITLAEIISMPIEKEVDLSNVDHVIDWFNIVFKSTMLDKIEELHSKDIWSLYLNETGKVIVDGSEVYDYEMMPPLNMWNVIIDGLAEVNIFAEIEENQMLISWATI